MKTFLEYTEDNKLHSFEISNMFCSRRKATKIAESVDGVNILRRPQRFFSWFSEEVFCEFELDGIHFQIDEPFGDNSRYWVGSPEKNNSAPLEKVLKAFSDA